MIITFLGHSDYSEKKEHKKLVLNYIEKIAENNEVVFYLGGYGAFDRCAREWCLEYKKTHPKTKLILVLPYLNKNYITKDYDETIYPPLETVPKRLAIVRRNAFMVEQADFIIAYVYRCGGAKNSLDIAIKKKKSIFNIVENEK